MIEKKEEVKEKEEKVATEKEDTVYWTHQLLGRRGPQMARITEEVKGEKEWAKEERKREREEKNGEGGNGNRIEGGRKRGREKEAMRKEKDREGKRRRKRGISATALGCLHHDKE